VITFMLASPGETMPASTARRYRPGAPQRQGDSGTAGALGVVKAGEGLGTLPAIPA
jgi:hypothetical protein